MISCGSGWRWTQWWTSSQYRPCLCQCIWTGAGWVSLQTLLTLFSSWPSCQSLQPRAAVTGAAQTTDRWDKGQTDDETRANVWTGDFRIIKPCCHGLLSLSVAANPRIATKCHGLGLDKLQRWQWGLGEEELGRMIGTWDDLDSNC